MQLLEGMLRNLDVEKFLGGHLTRGLNKEHLCSIRTGPMPHQNVFGGLDISTI